MKLKIWKNTWANIKRKQTMSIVVKSLMKWLDAIHLFFIFSKSGLSLFFTLVIILPICRWGTVRIVRVCIHFCVNVWVFIKQQFLSISKQGGVPFIHPPLLSNYSHFSPCYLPPAGFAFKCTSFPSRQMNAYEKWTFLRVHVHKYNCNFEIILCACM